YTYVPDTSMSSYIPHSILYFVILMRPATRSTLFPYTTLFRSRCIRCSLDRERHRVDHQLPFDRGQDDEPTLRRQPGLAEVGRERSEEHTSELQSPYDLVCRLLLEKKK